MRRITLDGLELVDAIERKGSFSGAAEVLHKVPSTISYTVARLEEDLQVQLFRRNGPRIEITEAGQELLRDACCCRRRASWSLASSAWPPDGNRCSGSPSTR